MVILVITRLINYWTVINLIISTYCRYSNWTRIRTKLSRIFLVNVLIKLLTLFVNWPDYQTKPHVSHYLLYFTKDYFGVLDVRPMYGWLEKVTNTSVMRYQMEFYNISSKENKNVIFWTTPYILIGTPSFSPCSLLRQLFKLYRVVKKMHFQCFWK